MDVTAKEKVLGIFPKASCKSHDLWTSSNTSFYIVLNAEWEDFKMLGINSFGFNAQLYKEQDAWEFAWRRISYLLLKKLEG